MGSLALTVAAACNDGIDPISYVDPGPDQVAPTVAVSYPIEGTMVRVREDVAPISIKLEANDDIEIKNVVISLDGNNIKTFDSFKDYRRALETYTYESLGNGDHILAVTVTDVSGKSTTETINFQKVAPYKPVYDGEDFYMPFDGDFLELVSITDATVNGSPTYSSAAKSGKAYVGATDAYLSLTTPDGILGDEFSAAFWYKIDGTPDRSGIITVSPPDPEHPAVANIRTSGFRFFREGSATKQTFKLNVGTGDGESWFDGGDAASIDPTTTTGWIHLAFTISKTKGAVYINGVKVSEGDLPGASWTGCDLVTIASGAPRFIEWGHLSDDSMYDELRFFNKALTQSEIQALMN